MDNEWKDETCGTCDFTANDWFIKTYCVGGGKRGKLDMALCRKNPPSFEERYPIVYKDTLACSCWRGLK
jgi:hypothetical protein